MNPHQNRAGRVRAYEAMPLARERKRTLSQELKERYFRLVMQEKKHV